MRPPTETQKTTRHRGGLFDSGTLISMDLSIVTTLYRSAPFVDELYARVSAAARAITRNYEIVFVNDGSPDESLARVVALTATDPCVRVVDLSRNFGHHRAIMTGIAHAAGDRIFLIDSDLEEAPELLATFSAEMNASDADVIYGVQAVRNGDAFHRLSGSAFYTLFNALSEHRIAPNLATVRLMSKRYAAALLEHDEREIFLAGLWAITGFEQRPMLIEKKVRKGTSYTLERRIALFVNALTSFSSKPLVMIFYLGALISAAGLGGALLLIIRTLFYGAPLMSGWPSIMVSIWFLGGLTIFCLGIIGMYLSKIFAEVKRRPNAIVRRVYEGGAAADRRTA